MALYYIQSAGGVSQLNELMTFCHCSTQGNGINGLLHRRPRRCARTVQPTTLHKRHDYCNKKSTLQQQYVSWTPTRICGCWSMTLHKPSSTLQVSILVFLEQRIKRISYYSRCLRVRPALSEDLYKQVKGLHPSPDQPGSMFQELLLLRLTLWQDTAEY
jgi:hypothetical protein